MSQRKSSAAGAALPPSTAGDEPLKFMSVILTYLGFNVTKKASYAKYSRIRLLWPDSKPCRNGLPLEYSAIVLTLRLSVDIAQNILDFAPSAKAETGPRAGGPGPRT